MSLDANDISRIKRLIEDLTISSGRVRKIIRDEIGQLVRPGSIPSTAVPSGTFSSGGITVFSSSPSTIPSSPNAHYIAPSGISEINLPSLSGVIDGTSFTVYNPNDSSSSSAPTLVLTSGSDRIPIPGSLSGTSSVGIPSGHSATFIKQSSDHWRMAVHGLQTAIAWMPGEQVASGYATATSNSNGAGDKLSFTVTGDGYTAMLVEAIGHAQTSGAAGTGLYYEIRDGASGGGSSYGACIYNIPVSNYGMPFYVKAIIPGFEGTKTFYLHLNNTSGTPFAADSSYGTRRWMRATWAPNYIES